MRTDMDLNELTTLGARVKHVRALRGLNQIELARRADVPQTTLSKIERGAQKRSGDVGKLSVVLGVNAIWLSDGVGPMSNVQSAGNVTQSAHHRGHDDLMIYQYADPRCPHGPRNASLPELPQVAFSRDIFEEESLDETRCFAVLSAPRERSLLYADSNNPRESGSGTYGLRQGRTCVLRDIEVTATGGYRITGKGMPTEEVSARDAGAVDIAGRVVWSGGFR